MISAEQSKKFVAVFADVSAKIDASLEAKSIESCRQLIQEAQKLVNSYSEVLPSRDLQNYKERIDGYKKRFDESKAPKKKFGFSRAAKEAVDEASEAAKATKDEKPKVEVVRKQHQAAFSCADKSDEEVELNEVHGEVELRNLSKCKVRISGTPATLYMSDVHDCVVVCDPVATSILIVGFNRSILHAACQQMRIHKAEDATFRIHVSSRSIIEDCNGISFGPLPSDYTASEESWNKSGLAGSKNNFAFVDDFNWLNTQQVSPNWKLVD